MPTEFFSSRQRVALDAFPEVVSSEDRERFFTFSDADRGFVARFGDGAVDVALMLGSLRMLGFVLAMISVSGGLLSFVDSDLGLVVSDDDDVTEVVGRSR